MCLARLSRPLSIAQVLNTAQNTFRTISKQFPLRAHKISHLRIAVESQQNLFKQAIEADCYNYILLFFCLIKFISTVYRKSFYKIKKFTKFYFVFKNLEPIDCFQSYWIIVI